HRGAAPEDAATVDGQALARVEDLARCGLDAVRRDQAGPFHRNLPARGRGENRLHAAGSVLPAQQVVTGEYTALPQLPTHLVQEHHLQLAPVDGVLGKAVTRRQPTRFRPDLLAELVVVMQSAGANADPVQLWPKAQLVKHTGGMRQQV